MEKLIINVSWSSNEYSETPVRVELLITDELKERVRLCKKLIKEHKLDCIKIEAHRVTYFGEEGESEWRSDVETLNITSYGVYYYAQSKYDSADQIESENIDMLFNL